MSYLESLRVFVRVVELGSITAGGRDLRLTPAVASKRLKELEQRLGVRLLNRTTRSLNPTEIGADYYDHARKVIDALDFSEAVVAGFSGSPRGAIKVAAPQGVGRRIVAPLIPRFVERYPDIDVRLWLSDRNIDILGDGLDVAFYLGVLQDSTLTFRKIRECRRVLCATPDYLEKHGVPQTPDDLLSEGHNCLLLRFPRSPEYFWMLQTPDGPRKLEVSGKFDADDGDVLTAWARDGRGIANRPHFDVAQDLREGKLVEVLPGTPPVPASFGCLYPHRRLQAPKVRLFVDFAVKESLARIEAMA